MPRNLTTKRGHLFENITLRKKGLALFSYVHSGCFYLIFIVQLSFTRLWPLWISLAAGAILSVFLIHISHIMENVVFFPAD